MKRLAVTGGVGEGKSTVLDSIRGAGLESISADDVVASLWGDAEVLDELRIALEAHEPITRELVRARILADPRARRAVNRVFHRRTVDAMLRSSAVALEIPLLIEACLHGEFDCVWVVTCGPEEQERRLAARLGNLEQARKLIATQIPTRVKEAFADRVIRTIGLPEIVHEDVLAGLRADGF